LTTSPLDFPLESGPEAAPMTAAPGEDQVMVPNLRLVDPLSTTPAVDRLHEICHDMRQPVASILMLADATLTDDSIPAVVRASLGRVRAQAEWLGDLLQHLLEPYSTGNPNGQAHDLTRIAIDAVAAAQATYRGDLRLQLSGGNLDIFASPIELRRVIANLLSNAIRAAGPQGQVVVELRSAGDQVLLTVDDNGPGFGLIRRDVGLGLRAAAQSMTSCGGRIEFRRSPQGGTRAVLILRPANG
jgi:C4-dicarboxylate-specific signal transduction histidine kinase